MNDKTIVLTLYGTKETINDFSITLFDESNSFREDSKANEYCSNINELQLEGDNWVYAAIIKENQKTKLTKSGYVAFDVISSLDDRSIQRILRELDNLELAKALKFANKETLKTILRNMSKRAAILLIENMGYMGPIRFKHVKEAQGKIVKIIQHLEACGEIVVPKSSHDKIV